MLPVPFRNQRIPRIALFLLFGCCLGITSLLPIPPGGEDLWAGDLQVEIKGPGTASVQGDIIRIQTEAGSRFIVILPSNPTTGYSWQFGGGDPSICSIEENRYEGSETGRVGAGGYELWIFRATGHGRTQGVFTYVRPWENDQNPIRTIQLEVMVR